MLLASWFEKNGPPPGRAVLGLKHELLAIMLGFVIGEMIRPRTRPFDEEAFWIVCSANVEIERDF